MRMPFEKLSPHTHHYTTSKPQSDGISKPNTIYICWLFWACQQQQQRQRLRWWWQRHTHAWLLFSHRLTFWFGFFKVSLSQSNFSTTKMYKLIRKVLKRSQSFRVGTMKTHTARDIHFTILTLFQPRNFIWIDALAEIKFVLSQYSGEGVLQSKSYIFSCCCCCRFIPKDMESIHEILKIHFEWINCLLKIYARLTF